MSKIWRCRFSLTPTLVTIKRYQIVNLPHLKKKGLRLLKNIAARRWKSENSTGLPCNILTCDQAELPIFDRYKKFENSRAKPSHASAQHIGFAMYLKIAQTCILHYYSTYCKQIGRKRNFFLVKKTEC